MPYINLQITKGATREQKAQIVKEFTETLVPLNIEAANEGAFR